MTEAERVAKASISARKWLRKRLARAREFEIGDGPGGFVPRCKCFFCGQDLTHVNDGGKGWHFWLNPSPGVFIESMYCADECQGSERPPESLEAKAWLMWREDCGRFGGHYVEVVGEMGPHGKTPQTTEYQEDDLE